MIDQLEAERMKAQIERLTQEVIDLQKLAVKRHSVVNSLMADKTMLVRNQNEMFDVIIKHHAEIERLTAERDAARIKLSMKMD